MKIVCLFGLLLLCIDLLAGPNDSLAPAIVKPAEKEKPKPMVFGASLGFNSVFQKLFEARISPVDGRLLIEELPQTSFLLSTALTVPLGRNSKSTSGLAEVRRKKKRPNLANKSREAWQGWFFVATVNILSFNSAVSGSLFNQKLDGGLGLGYGLNQNLQLSLTYEMLSVRQPRDFLLEYFRGMPLESQGKAVSRIEPEDDDYFRDMYLPSISVKFIYTMNGRAGKA